MYRLNPFTERLDRREIPKKELREFFDQFIGTLGQRTLILTEEVRRDDAFAAWMPDLSSNSLDSLGAWFVVHVHSRRKTETELLIDQTSSLGPVSSITLTDSTFSLAADTGMYFARVMMAAFPHLRWKLPLGSKTFVDYGQAVLEGFQKGVLLNPVRVATVVAHRALTGTADPHELHQALRTWSALVQAPPD